MGLSAKTFIFIRSCKSNVDTCSLFLNALVDGTSIRHTCWRCAVQQQCCWWLGCWKNDFVLYDIVEQATWTNMLFCHNTMLERVANSSGRDLRHCGSRKNSDCACAWLWTICSAKLTLQHVANCFSVWTANHRRLDLCSTWTQSITGRWIPALRL